MSDADDEVFRALRARAERNAAERDAAVSALRDLIAYVRKVGGFMEAGDQNMLWRAAAIAEELGR